MAEWLLADLPKGAHVLADKGYDADWIRELIEDTAPRTFLRADIATTVSPTARRATSSAISSSAASTSLSSSATSLCASIATR